MRVRRTDGPLTRRAVAVARERASDLSRDGNDRISSVVSWPCAVRYATVVSVVSRPSCPLSVVRRFRFSLARAVRSPHPRRGISPLDATRHPFADAVILLPERVPLRTINPSASRHRRRSGGGGGVHASAMPAHAVPATPPLSPLLLPPPPPVHYASTEPRFRRCVRKFFAHLFSNLGLFGLVAGYVIVGAFVFRFLEAGNERQQRDRIGRLKNDCLGELWNITGIIVWYIIYIGI